MQASTWALLKAYRLTPLLSLQKDLIQGFSWSTI